MEEKVHTAPKSDSKQMILIIIAILGMLCCVVIGSVVGFYYLFDFQMDQQALAEETAQAQATSTAVSQATQVAKYEFFDDFTNNSNNWYVSPVVSAEDGWNGSINITAGKYIWFVKDVSGAEAFTWREYENQKPVQDFDLSVDVKQASGISGTLCPGVAFRVIFKGAYIASYVLSICDDGQFNVTYYDSDTGWETIQTWTPSTAIHSGDWNNLSISGRGSHFVLSINNVIVSEFDDNRIPRGRAFLVLQAFNAESGSLWFDNFGVQSR